MKTFADKIIKQIAFVISGKVWPLQTLSLSLARRVSPHQWPEPEWDTLRRTRPSVEWSESASQLLWVMWWEASSRVIICQCIYWHIRGFVFRHFRKWEKSIGWFHAEFARISRVVRTTLGLISSPDFISNKNENYKSEKSLWQVHTILCYRWATILIELTHSYKVCETIWEKWQLFNSRLK